MMLCYATDEQMYKAVLFDLDDTLIAQDASDEASFRAVCAYAGERRAVDAPALHGAIRRHADGLWRAAPTFAYADRIGIGYAEGLWARFTGDSPDLEALRAWTPAYRRAAWSGALRAQDVDDAPLAEELAALFGEERRGCRAPYPDAEPILRALREEYRLALVTNGAPDLQREKLHASGLEYLFHAMIVSGEAGVGKPDPRIFALVLERIGVRPAEAVMVGDNPARDIAGAQRAGIRAVFVERPGIRRQLGSVAPDARITGLHELRDILRRLS